MSCCLVQSEAVAPTVDQLKRACRAIGRLTDADATKLALESFGLWFKDLTREEAAAAQRALQADGVPMEMVEIQSLPKLPEAKVVRRLEIKGQTLLIYDPLGRPLPIEGRHLMLLAAGAVRHFGVDKTPTEERRLAYDPIRGFHKKTVIEVRHRVESAQQYLVDLFLTGGTVRFQIEAASFLFGYALPQPEPDVGRNVATLVQRLCQCAPQTQLNRGAVALRDHTPQALDYASRITFFDESVWWLWRLRKGLTAT